MRPFDLARLQGKLLTRQIHQNSDQNNQKVQLKRAYRVLCSSLCRKGGAKKVFTCCFFFAAKEEENAITYLAFS